MDKNEPKKVEVKKEEKIEYQVKAQTNICQFCKEEMSRQGRCLTCPTCGNSLCEV